MFLLPGAETASVTLAAAPGAGVRAPAPEHVVRVYGSCKFGPTTADAGLNAEGKERLSMHDLRHTFASHLILDLKLDIVTVSRQLGHSRPSVTSDVYAHLFDQARHAEDIRQRMAESDFGKLLELRSS
jgi:integrase